MDPRHGKPPYQKRGQRSAIAEATPKATKKPRLDNAQSVPFRRNSTKLSETELRVMNTMDKDTTLCPSCDCVTQEEKDVAWQYSKNFQYMKRKADVEQKKRGDELAASNKSASSFSHGCKETRHGVEANSIMQVPATTSGIKSEKAAAAAATQDQPPQLAMKKTVALAKHDQNDQLPVFGDELPLVTLPPSKYEVNLNEEYLRTLSPNESAGYIIEEANKSIKDRGIVLRIGLLAEASATSMGVPNETVQQQLYGA